MPRDYAALPKHQLRRHDRAVEDDAWIRDFLARAPVCAIATVHDGQPFLHSNLFVYDAAAHALFFHTARVGRTRANVEHDGAACFTAFEMGRLLPADTALEFSVEYAGVTVFGPVSVVEDRAEARRVLQLLLGKYAPHLRPGRDYRATTDEELDRTAVFRLDVEVWSAKKKEVEADFPGAFLYGAAPAGPSATDPRR